MENVSAWFAFIRVIRGGSGFMVRSADEGRLNMELTLAILLFGYLMGSIPSAVIMSRRVAGVDIRTLGDANAGARNVSRTLGWKPALVVAVVDFFKGFAPVMLAKTLRLDLGWQIATGFCALLGHDFPVFAQFQGGQGMATTLGLLLALAPGETLCGLAVYGTLYLITRTSDLGAGVGIGLLVLLMVLARQPLGLIVSSLVMILSIPAKQALDRPRRLRVRDA
jgi:glycerol-3-phosphate acyltransferase PlsY